MLEHTFLHAAGIGPKTEEELWARGIHTWEALAAHGKALPARAQGSAQQIEGSRRALERGDAGYFAGLGRYGETWRAWPEFADRCVFLDIETSGLEWETSEISVIGLFDGYDYRAFIQGQNLDQAPRELARYAMVVTFNGASFDLPFIRSVWPGIELPALHVDLRWALHKLNWRGGLGAVEERLGIRRDAEIDEVDGFEAVRLWQAYRRGQRGALERLVAYNQADVVNLKMIMEAGYGRLRKLRAPFLG